MRQAGIDVHREVAGPWGGKTEVQATQEQHHVVAAPVSTTPRLPFWQLLRRGAPKTGFEERSFVAGEGRPPAPGHDRRFGGRRSNRARASGSLPRKCW